MAFLFGDLPECETRPGAQIVMNLERLNLTDKPGLLCVSLHPCKNGLLPLLAQLPAAGADQFRDWLVSAAAVLAVGALIRQFVRKPPLEAEFLSKKEFGEAQRKLERDLDSVWASWTGRSKG